MQLFGGVFVAEWYSSLRGRIFLVLIFVLNFEDDVEFVD